MSIPAIDPKIYLDLIGAPYVPGARGPASFDCVGMAIEVQRRRGFAVPDFVSTETELHRQLAAGGILGGCQQLDEPEPGCVALIRMGLNEHHLAVMVSRFQMLHTSAQTGGVVIERVLSPLWNRRLLGFYRLGVQS